MNSAVATVTLDGLSATYDGTSKSAVVTTSPSGLAVNLTYDGGSTPPLNAGTYSVSAQVNHPNYSGSASGSLVIAPASQKISFDAPANLTFGGSPVALVASASSGLPRVTPMPLSHSSAFYPRHSGRSEWSPP